MNQWLSADFWHTIFQISVQWMMTTAPSLLMISILAFAAIKVVRFFIHRIKTFIITQWKRSSTGFTTEIEKRVDTLLGILQTTLQVILWCVIIMISLKKLGLDIAPLVAGAGIVGLAIGFGAQELVRDIISGFFMLLENQIRTGDVIMINGTGGLVESINLRTITLRDLSGVIHIFQNGKIQSLSNMTKGWSAMVFDINVAYKEDTDRVVTIMTDVGADLQSDPKYSMKIIAPLEIFGVDQFAESSVVIKARFKTLPINQWEVGREYLRRLKKAFDTHGIELPFPHRTIYWHPESAALQMHGKQLPPN